MKGILLAGGHGTRLYPITYGVNKHLLPIYDKPMIYYSLSILMLTDIRELLIISTSKEINRFMDVLGNGSRLGMKISYKEQETPGGLAEAFILGEEFIGNSDVMLVLGDNILIGQQLSELLIGAANSNKGATVFAYPVNDTSRFGAIRFNYLGNPLELVEKPTQNGFKYAVIGIYMFTNDVVKKAKALKPSARGELEITDLNNEYLKEGRLDAKILSRAHLWIDAGTIDSLWEASTFIRSMQSIQSLKIGAIDEIAFRKGWITKKNLLEYAQSIEKTEYGQYLKHICSE